MIGRVLRILPDFKGKQRLSRLLLKNKISTLRDIIIKGSYGCTYKLPNIKENVGFDIYINGMFEKESIRFIQENLPATGVLVDIGANIGSICLPICVQRPDIKAICIEASPRVYNYLAFNVANNQVNNCITVNKAMMDVDGQIVDFYSPVEKFGKGSLTSVFTKEAETIETISLDTLLEQNNIFNVDFIKVDIEGFEYYAFKGAKKLLNKPDAPGILFEFSRRAEEHANLKAGSAQQLLFDYGYQLFTLTADNKRNSLLVPQTTRNAMIFATKNRTINK